MKVLPEIIKGNSLADDRGTLQFNNDFNAFGIKRIYTIQNIDTQFIRGWQGHKIESRWFTAVSGSFIVKIVKIDDWEHPNPNSEIVEFVLNAEKLDVLHVCKGSCTSIQATQLNSKLLVMSDYLLGEAQDEYRFPNDYFTN